MLGQNQSSPLMGALGRPRQQARPMVNVNPSSAISSGMQPAYSGQMNQSQPAMAPPPQLGAARQALGQRAPAAQPMGQEQLGRAQSSLMDALTRTQQQRVYQG